VAVYLDGLDRGRRRDVVVAVVVQVDDAGPADLHGVGSAGPGDDQPVGTAAPAHGPVDGAPPVGQIDRVGVVPRVTAAVQVDQRGIAGRSGGGRSRDGPAPGDGDGSGGAGVPRDGGGLARARGHGG